MVANRIRKLKIKKPMENVKSVKKIKPENNREGRMLTGMFADRESSENAYQTLHERGYSKDDINLIMSDETRKKHFQDDDHETEIGTKAAEGAGKGSAIGGTVGAITGIIAAIGTSFIIPGLGVLIAGPIAAGLAGAGAGGSPASPPSPTRRPAQVHAQGGNCRWTNVSRRPSSGRPR